MANFQKRPNILLALTEEDRNYVDNLRTMCAGYNVRATFSNPITVADLVGRAKAAGLNCAITTNQAVLKGLLPAGRVKSASLDNYAGSLIRYGDFEFVVINPLKQLHTVPYGKFLAQRYLSKVTTPDKWATPVNFDWTIVSDSSIYQIAKHYLAECDFIALDIETGQDLYMDCVGFCGVKLSSNESMTFVVDIESMQQIHWVRELCALKVPKCAQNGKYDAAYLSAYGCPMWGYYYDTANAFHSWYAELPKDLASIAAFFVRDVMYWKDLGKSGDKETRLKYNALDCWSTAASWIEWTRTSPKWAKANYVREFTQIPICHMMEMTGIKRDIQAVEKANEEFSNKMDEILSSIQIMVDTPEYNPRSSQQTLRLIHALGYKNVTSTEEKFIQELIYASPLAERIFGSLLDYRELGKLVSTYLSVGDKAKEFKERILYSINPHGTDTSRKSSKAHHFWCGLNIQNVPRDGKVSGEVKRTFVADEGFEFAEADYSQAEARGVAYKSGDEGLIEVVESDKDFHSLNASSFFGVPYEQIYRDAIAAHYDNETGEYVEAIKKKTLDPDLRDLSKRVNHGANYNMGPKVLLETMGSRNVRKAQSLLKLPRVWTLLEVCKYLLMVYEKTYPRVKTTYYQKIKKDIKTSSKLQSDLVLTRYCFGNPEKSKQALNSYVAHVTQSLNAEILDEAARRVFIELGFHKDFKFLAQIHDSLFFQYRKGQSWIPERVKELMTFPVPITDCLGITRQMVVPVDIKLLGTNWAGH